MALEQVNSIIKSIKSGQIAPVYVLMGEEPYYIDVISQFIEHNVLSEAERGFNQIVLYGRDTKVEEITEHAKRFPMMSERQVLIVKEAQDLSRTIEQLAQCVATPQMSTVLVLCYKYKKLDARKKLLKLAKANGVVFESKKLYDNQIPDWIKKVLLGRGRHIEPKAAQMLADFLGNDLSKINKELEKLSLVIPESNKIDAAAIQEHVGISKDYNNFELQSAIAKGDRVRAYSIAQYFANNPKHHPVIMTISLLYNFYSKLLIYHSLSDKSSAPKALGINPYFVREYQTAAQNFPMKRVSRIIASIRTIDMKSKGLGTVPLAPKDLLQELLLAIFD
jgi:DNA polymerase-3 subunit delta